jgi:hypothetical protein
MKRTDKTTATATVGAEPLAKSNGQTAAGTELAAANMSVILASLQTMRDGDFSVRLPEWTGLPGKIADTFNDMNQRWQGIKACGTSGGKEGGRTEANAFHSQLRGERWKFPLTRLWTTCYARQRK